MFKVYLTNFGRFTEGVFTNIEDARKECKRVGFDCTIYLGKLPISVYSTISGFRSMASE